MQRGASLEHLGDVGDVGAFLARHEPSGHPGDREVRGAGVENRGGHDLHGAFEDGHVEAGILVEAEIERRVVPSELRLGEPLQLQRDLGELRRRDFAGGSRSRRGVVALAARSGDQAQGQHRRQ